MKNTQFVGFRAADEDRRKLERLSAITGQGFSEVLRTLVRSADIEPVQSYRVVAKNADSHSTLNLVGTCATAVGQ